jgi:hypothetical protein
VWRSYVFGKSTQLGIGFFEISICVEIIYIFYTKYYFQKVCYDKKWSRCCSGVSQKQTDISVLWVEVNPHNVCNFTVSLFILLFDRLIYLFFLDWQPSFVFDDIKGPMKWQIKWKFPSSVKVIRFRKINTTRNRIFWNFNLMSYIYPASAVCIFLFGHCNWLVWSLASRFFDKLILDHVTGHNIIFLLMINRSYVFGKSTQLGIGFFEISICVEIIYIFYTKYYKNRLIDHQ